MRRLLLVSVTVLCGVVAYAPVPTARASATIRVPSDHATIQSAIDAASTGDTVLVAPGVYHEKLHISGKVITLKSQFGPQATRLDGSEFNSTVVTLNSDSTITGFTISGGRASFGGGIEILLASPTIDGNIFESNTGFGAAIWANISSARVERNVFRTNTCDTQHLSGVVTFINSSSPTIWNNLFADNACRAINITIPEGNAPTVVNNTITRNRVGIHIDVRIPTGAQAYRNNIVVGNGVGVEAVFGPETNSPQWDHNLVFANGTDYVGLSDRTGVDGNVSADPLFTQSEALDLRIAAGSPAIDTGTATNAPSRDFASNPRPFDGDGDGAVLPDIGAFEYVVCGDVNHDGAVTGRDIGLIQQHRRDGTPYGSYDINLDGRVDAVDARAARAQLREHC